MRKLLIVAGIIVILVSVNVIAVAVLDQRIEQNRKALRAAGHPVTIAELPKHLDHGSAELNHILALADTALDERLEKRLLARADSNQLEPAELQSLLARNTRALELLLAASRYPRQSIYYDPDNCMAALLPTTLKRSFDFGALLRAQARSLYLAGRADSAMDMMLADLRLADLLPSEAALLFTLVRQGDMMRTLRQMREVASRCSDPMLALAAEAIAALDVDKTLLHTWEAEAAMMNDWLARPSPAQFAASGVNNPFHEFLLLFPLTNRIAQFENQRIRRECLDLAGRPFYEAAGRWRDLEELYEARKRQHSLLAAFMSPNGRLFAVRAAKLQAERAVTLAGLRVIQYQRRHGALPAGLADAGAETTLDPFTGRTLSYQRAEKGFSLQSTGEDWNDTPENAHADIIWLVAI